MSWEPILNTGPRKAPPVQVDVAVGCSKAGRQRPYCFVLIRGETLDQSPWLQLGQVVDVLLGSGDHAGMVRVVPGTAWVVGKPMAGKRAKNTTTLRFYPPFSMPGGGMVCAAVEFDYGADWLEFTLPAWTKSKVAAEPVKQPVSSKTVVLAATSPKLGWPAARDDMALSNKKERRA